MIANETLAHIQNRRSIRSYRPDAVERGLLEAVVEAGRFAPFAEAGSRHFAAVQNQQLIRRIDAMAKEAAVGMPVPALKQLGENPAFQCLYGAPAAILISGREASVAWEQDCAAAAQNILIAAQSLGLGSCWIYFATLAFYHPQGEALKQELQIPSGFKPVASIALGYPD